MYPFLNSQVPFIQDCSETHIEREREREMGVTGGLVRSIFFRNKSFGTHDYTNNVNNSSLLLLLKHLLCLNFVMFQGRSNLGEKKRWSSVRSYLCGDEFNSVLAVHDSGSIKDSLDPLLTISQQLSSDSVQAIQDSASVKLHQEEDSVSGKNSEVSVTQPLHKEEQSEEATETHIPKRHHQTTLISKLFLEEDAAIIIQSAFRSYLVLFFFFFVFFFFFCYVHSNDS